MKKIAIIGDVHIRRKSPYYESSVEVLDWISNNEEINNAETLLIFLGDIFEYDENGGDLNKLVLAFLQSLKNKDKLILEGNHDGDINYSALEALTVVPGVRIIDFYEVREIGGKTFLFLPHIYTDSKGVTMEEFYSNLRLEEDIDYCCGHIMDESRSFGSKSKFCDLSNLNIKKRVFGHDHTFNMDQGGSYLGSIQPNSSTEKDKTPKIFVVDLEKDEDYTVDVPLFINYHSVSYPDPLPEINVKYPVLNITESLDREESVKFYMDEAEKQGLNLTINRVFRKRVMNDKVEIEGDTKDLKTDRDYFEVFSKEKELSAGVADIVRRVIA